MASPGRQSGRAFCCSFACHSYETHIFAINAHRCLCRRKRAGLPPLSDRDLELAILQLKSGAVANFVPQGMRLSTSHSTCAINRDVRSERYASRYHVTPVQEELARRQFMIGLRVRFPSLCCYHPCCCCCCCCYTCFW